MDRLYSIQRAEVQVMPSEIDKFIHIQRWEKKITGAPTIAIIFQSCLAVDTQTAN